MKSEDVPQGGMCPETHAGRLRAGTVLFLVVAAVIAFRLLTCVPGMARNLGGESPLAR